MKLQYCTRCIYPNTKPRLTFDEQGVCSACRAFERRQEIDWEAREQEFRQLVQEAKGQNHWQSYDCVVPVSGGKDSTYQVVMALKYGLRPLAVTAMTDHLTWVGQHNLDNISRLGVDHVMVQTNAKLRRKLNKLTLETVGDISWAEHVTIFTVPIREALMRSIPMVIYGENPENEYGGPFEAQGRHQMTRDWLEEFGGLNGLRPSDIIDQGIGSRDDFFQYTYPDAAELYGALDMSAVFLGHYFPWDGEENVRTAQAHGFNSFGPAAAGQMEGENLDNAQTGIHDRFKYLKFGFGRVTDHCCNAIRRGRMTRAAAVNMANAHDGAFPSQYVRIPLEMVLARIGMTLTDYIRCERQFANPALFKKDDAGLMQRKFKVD